MSLMPNTAGETPVEFRGRNQSSYGEVRRTIALNAKKREKQVEDLSEEVYVDAYRNMAVKLGEQTDLKRVMKNHRGFGSAPVAVTTVHDLGPGDPDDETYLKQAKHLMRKGELASAVEYVGFALRINPASKNAMSTRARCLLLMGQWKSASMAADAVLDSDRLFLRAMLIKAEALYNTCDFEHALVLFHRGRIVFPENETFRLGIQKCRKAIETTLSSDFNFICTGVNALFKRMGKVFDKEDAEAAEREMLDLKEEEEPRIARQKLLAKREIAFEAAIRETIEEVHNTKNKKSAAKKSRKKMTAPDRLQKDRNYLERLSEFADESGVELRSRADRRVAKTAKEALRLLSARDEFWRQVDPATRGLPPDAHTTRIDFEKLGTVGVYGLR